MNPRQKHSEAPAASGASADLPADAACGRSIPGPAPMFGLGWRGNAVRFFRNPIAYVSRLFGRYGHVACLAHGGNGPLFAKSESGSPRAATVFGFGERCNRTILEDAEVFQTRTPPGPPTRAYRQLSTNLLFTNGPRHDDLRHLLRPAFTRESLQKYYPTMVAYCDELLFAWEGKREVDLNREMTGLALKISSKCFYGLDPSMKGQQLATLMHEMHTRLFSPGAVVPIDLPGCPYRKLIVCMERIVEALQRTVAGKDDGGEAADLVSELVRVHELEPEKLTRDELIGNGFLLFFGGHETTSKALAWTLFLLAEHPEVAADLQDELTDALHGGAPTYDQLYQLPLLDRVIKESLRLFPPASLLPRVATRDTTLGGFDIAAGTEVVFSPYVTHRDPEIFPEPKKFLADRWLELKPSAFAYLPFGARARTCMGLSFAGMQLRIVLPMILQKYRLQVSPKAKINVKANTVMGPDPGVPAEVHRQDRDFRRHGDVRGFVREMVDLA